MIWKSCDGTQFIQPLSGELFRLIESQEQIATLGYVDTLEEQEVLEQLLDQTKPNIPQLGKKPASLYHYLLTTPFRYPPLQWGSRFGRKHETSIFYGGCSIAATLAESAYYRFVFWWSMDAEAVKAKINSEHTLFAVDYDAEKGVKLHQAPFNEYSEQLCHPSDYKSSQQLGSDMRESDVEVFEYASARERNNAACVGLFVMDPFVQLEPKYQEPWLCELTENTVAYRKKQGGEIHRFDAEQFLINGQLPSPA